MLRFIRFCKFKDAFNIVLNEAKIPRRQSRMLEVFVRRHWEAYPSHWDAKVKTFLASRHRVDNLNSTYRNCTLLWIIIFRLVWISNAIKSPHRKHWWRPPVSLTFHTFCSLCYCRGILCGGRGGKDLPVVPVYWCAIPESRRDIGQMRWRTHARKSQFPVTRYVSEMGVYSAVALTQASCMTGNLAGW